MKTGLGICQHAELPLSAWSRSNSYLDSTERSDYGLFDIRHPVLVEYARALLTDEVHSGPQGDALTGETGQSGNGSCSNIGPFNDSTPCPSLL
jgi:hypothetical protein